MEIFGTKTFVLEDDVRMQAFKVCEEAFELYQEAKHLDDETVETRENRMSWLRTEAADVIQTVLNLYDMLGFTEDEVMDDMHACYRRNVMRGRVE